MQASTSSPRSVGRGGDGRALHRRMLVQHALDLDRRDVLAAAPDHVLLAVDEEEAAFGVAPHDVAGVEPAAGPGLLGRGVVLQVAGEEVAARIGARSRAPAARPACRAARRGLRRRRRALRRTARCGRSNGCRPGAARGRHDRAAGAGLGHRPGLDQREAEALPRTAAWFAVDAGAEAPAHRMRAIVGRRRRRRSASPASRRGNA